jgi:2-oxoglutarate dehydrogenase E2 component (dihydrolipoamide succinyltransferase)
MEGAVVVADQVLASMEPGAEAEQHPVEVEAGESVDGEPDDEDVAISPSARKMIAEHNLNMADIRGSGRGGRILKEDVQAFLKDASSAAPKADADSEKTASATAPVKTPSIDPTMTQGERVEKRVTMTRLRARIAERLLEAQQNAAILTTFNEVNMQPVMALRKKYQDQFEKQYGVRLGFMSLFAKAAVEALKRFPAVNASIDGDDIVYHGYFDIGVAVSSPRGLVVPVVRDVDQLSLSDIEKTIALFAEKARNNSLSMDDLQGGTFTLSNGGVFGSLLSTPILNPPQSGILGMHKIQQRPVVEDGEIVVRPMMYLALSYDHRIVDGREAVQFLVTIKDCLEDPARMLIGV